MFFEISKRKIGKIGKKKKKKKRREREREREREKERERVTPLAAMTTDSRFIQ